MERIIDVKELLPFREGLFRVEDDGSGYLIANRCGECKLTFFPKREFCVGCFKHDNLEEIKLNRSGTLHTFSVVHRTTPDFNTPYVIGYIDLEEDGVRVFAPITDCIPEDLEIGMKMELAFGELNRTTKSEGASRLLTYKFQPLNEDL